MFDWKKRDPVSPQELRRHAAVCASQDKYEEAISALRDALEVEPHHAAAWNLMGVCLTLLLRFDEATSSYDMAAECDPSMMEAYANSAWNACLGDPAKAGASFREWLSRRRAPEPVAVGAALKLDNVTLCCIDCANHELAARALRFSVSRCQFGEAVFFSDRDCDVDGVRWIEVPSIASAAHYSNFLIHELHGYINTDYVLVIQYDGFVLNPAAWDPTFLEYDYIGAKIPVAGGHLVGNGGFSLRSRKLLQALRDDQDIKDYDAFRDPYQEDLAICRGFRELLVSRYGIRFAPEAVADVFAAEQTAPAAANFGFHNLIHLAGLYQNDFRVRQSRSEFVDFELQAQTDIGMLTVRRKLNLSANPAFWQARADVGQ